MEYEEFLKTKKIKIKSTGFEVEESELNDNLFPFQKYCVKKALIKGRYALFQEPGSGKTIQFLEWSNQIVKKEKRPVLILSPLAVTDQTILEGDKFGIKVWKYGLTDPMNQDAFDHFKPRIYITNYEQLDNVDLDAFCGIVLDESSVLKSLEGKTKQKLIEKFNGFQYKLCCTGTPSPNDHTELGNHSEFLGYMSYHEMLAMFFVHDGGETSKWRLRKHAEKDFWNYVLSWSIAIDNPRTLGFDGTGFDLPPIEYIEHFIDVRSDSMNLFGEAIVNATDLHRDLKKSLNDRIDKALEIISQSPDEQFLIWGLGNEETQLITKKLDDCFNVQGSDKPEYKAEKLLGFALGEFKYLVTKTKIASFGMNYQNSCNQIFLSYNFQFEAFYQAVRRQYRFGQKNTVKVHLLIPKSQMNVRTSILEKEKKHKEMMHNLAKMSSEYEHNVHEGIEHEDVKTESYWLMQGDCVQRIKEVENESVHLQLFSPPFSELYVYSDKNEDMGNSKNYDEFEKHFKFLIPELFRTLKQGRICAIHCMDLPIQKGKEGYIGLRDFSGMIIKAHQDAGFIYHSRVTIWKNPVTEMQRTKALGLLHKQIKKDAAMSRVGIPDYVLFFRKPGENLEPIRHQDKYQNAPDYLPVDLWQKYASPVWYDVDYSRTLQYTTARDNKDEKHICPLQLDTISRVLHLYSNEGDTVLSPFGGIGSEGFQALKMGRKSISIELKGSYFKVNEQNHRNAILEKSVLTLF